ncbi:hypothetical protein FA13DRAFT_1729899 [Coprinellus micaceus]|uniref:Uncharacterized protein n=1 Tax=Coprinellus micaceus TaxID=71717 RepID=A0A4Y7TJN5_COPMI|nr:hypothetical protein FA13DRAFT_1729899 [Coprinellus micaceus]
MSRPHCSFHLNKPRKTWTHRDRRWVPLSVSLVLRASVPGTVSTESRPALQARLGTPDECAQ